MALSFRARVYPKFPYILIYYVQPECIYYLLRSRSRDKFFPRFNLGWVSALDVREWGVVELFGQCLGEKNSQFGVVDELFHQPIFMRVTYGNTEIDCCSSRSIIRIQSALCQRHHMLNLLSSSRPSDVDDRCNLIFFQYLPQLSLVLDRNENLFDGKVRLGIDVLLDIRGWGQLVTMYTHHVCTA